MNKQAVLRKLKKLEKVFSVSPRDRQIVVEMWMPGQEDPEKYDEMVREARQKMMAGERIVIMPLKRGKKGV